MTPLHWKMRFRLGGPMEMFPVSLYNISAEGEKGRTYAPQAKSVTVLVNWLEIATEVLSTCEIPW